MCITNIYIDRYPDGREVEFRQLSTCQYGLPGRPCSAHSTVENPVRRIQYDEAPTQNILNQPIFPSSPPLSSTSSQKRYSGGAPRASRSLSRSDDGRAYLKRTSIKPTRQHRKERIVVVDAPPTPTTPPQLFAGTFTAPSSPDPRSRPIIVDERPLHRAKSPNRRRPAAAGAWDSPSTSHTSFDLRAEREQRDREERTRRRREDQLNEEARRARLIAEANNDISRRAPIPMTSASMSAPIPIPAAAPQQRTSRTYLQPIVNQTSAAALQERMGALTLTGGVADDAMKQRLRERQMPSRRFTVGPGHRRHRVLYDDGVYRWE